MSDYKETDVSGKAWQRAQMIIISNHHGQVPTVTYQEEALIHLNGEIVQKPAGSLGYTIDLLAEIELRDPETLEPTGDTIPVALVQQALFSDYVNRAEARDAANAPVEAPAVDGPVS